MIAKPLKCGHEIVCMCATIGTLNWGEPVITSKVAKRPTDKRELSVCKIDSSALCYKCCYCFATTSLSDYNSMYFLHVMFVKACDFKVG